MLHDVQPAVSLFSQDHIRPMTTAAAPTSSSQPPPPLQRGWQQQQQQKQHRQLSRPARLSSASTGLSSIRSRDIEVDVQCDAAASPHVVAAEEEDEEEKEKKRVAPTVAVDIEHVKVDDDPREWSSRTKTLSLLFACWVSMASSLSANICASTSS